MITAIINARSSSERLPSKHLMKIGNKSILEHIIFKLKKIRKIQQIYIASGSKKKNYTYEKFIKGSKKDKAQIKTFETLKKLKFIEFPKKGFLELNPIIKMLFMMKKVILW